MKKRVKKKYENELKSSKRVTINRLRTLFGYATKLGYETRWWFTNTHHCYILYDEEYTMYDTKAFHNKICIHTDSCSHNKFKHKKHKIYSGRYILYVSSRPINLPQLSEPDLCTTFYIYDLNLKKCYAFFTVETLNFIGVVISNELPSNDPEKWRDSGIPPCFEFHDDTYGCHFPISLKDDYDIARSSSLNVMKSDIQYVSLIPQKL